MAAAQFGEFLFVTLPAERSAMVTLCCESDMKRRVFTHPFTKDELLGLACAAIKAARELKG